MSNNKHLWDRVKVTNPKAVKAITGKPYKGSSPKPYWLIERATEEFGPVGVGWGVIVKSERFERLTETDVLHVAVVSVWYVLDGKRSETFDQMGGTKAAYQSKSGMIVDEDAGKKSVTDGMVKCLSMIGFAGDIFSGMWDDSKYVQWAAEEWEEREPHQKGKPAVQSQDMSPQARAGRIMGGVAAGDAAGAALALSEMDQPTLDGIWQHIGVIEQDKLTAAWPKVAP